MFARVLSAAAACALLAPVAWAETGTLNWDGVFGAGFSMAGGAALPVGNEIWVGTFFDLSAAQLQPAISTGDLVGLGSRFYRLDSARIGDALPGSAFSNASAAQKAGHFEATGDFDTDVGNVADKQLVYWVFRTQGNALVNANFSNVLEIGIFWLSKSVNSDWAVPTSADFPHISNIEPSNLTNAGGTALANGATIAAGSFSNSTSALTGKRNFALLALPEPSTGLLLAGTLGMLAGRRWRRVS